MLATAQLGITVCSVLLGAVAEPALHHALVPRRRAARRLRRRARMPWRWSSRSPSSCLPARRLRRDDPQEHLAIAGPSAPRWPWCRRSWSVSRVLAPVISALNWLAKAGIRLFGVEPKDEVASAFTAEEVALDPRRVARRGPGRGRALRAARRRAGVQRQGCRRRGRAARRAGHRHRARRLRSTSSGSSPGTATRASRCSTTTATSGATCTSRTCCTPTRSSGWSRCPPSGCAGWPTCAATTRWSRCCRPCSAPGSHLARVVADDGQVVGVVFLEDVIEELVGEVSDSSHGEARRR